MSDFIGDRECVTHHHACDCREEKFKALQAQNTTLMAENKRYREGINNLRKAISGLLFSFNRHWIKMSLDKCVGTSPSEIATSVVKAEQALKDTQLNI